MENNIFSKKGYTAYCTAEELKTKFKKHHFSPDQKVDLQLFKLSDSAVEFHLTAENESTVIDVSPACSQREYQTLFVDKRTKSYKKAKKEPTLNNVLKALTLKDPLDNLTFDDRFIAFYVSVAYKGAATHAV